MIRDPQHYMLGDIRLPSVTDVLRITGLSDYSMVRDDVLENARVRGQDVDEFLTGIDTGLIPEDLLPDPRLAGYVEAYKRFRAETPFEISECQVPKVEKGYRFAGTPDRVGLLDGKAAVVDIKCVHAVQPETAVQLAAYALLTGASARYSLQLRPDGTYRLKEYTKPRDLHVFLGALSVVHWKIDEGRIAWPPEES